MNHDTELRDVTVIGCGLAGIAAAIHLAKAGLKVLCVEADAGEKTIVGESLDWSAPDLLQTLGLPMERLIAENIATYKRHVIVRSDCGGSQEYVPSPWLGKAPWNVELRTLHVDRAQLKAALWEIMLAHGVEILEDRVTGFERDGKRITGIQTKSGARISSRWVVDASGYAACLLPRLFNLPMYSYGPAKVALWSYFPVSESIEGTTIYIDGDNPSYLEWVWEIPIHPDTISVGYVLPGDAMKAKRASGMQIEDIYRERLLALPRFAPLLTSAQALQPAVTSFRCRGYRKTAGPNWLVVGEAASMVDPMTSNGVTAALRHAAEASALIVKHNRRGRLPLMARVAYSRRIQALSRFFNSGIEKVVYLGPIRRRIGALNAGDVYTVPAWSINVLYSRFRPRGVFATEAFGLFLALLRAAAAVFYWICSRFDTAPKQAEEMA